MRPLAFTLLLLTAIPAAAADLATDTKALYDGIVISEQALAAGTADLTSNAITKEALADKVANEILPALTLALDTWTAAADKVSTDTASPERAPYEDCPLAAGDMKNGLGSKERWLRGGSDDEAGTFDMYMQSFDIMKAACETALGISAN